MSYFSLLKSVSWQNISLILHRIIQIELSKSLESKYSRAMWLVAKALLHGC